ncbi:LEAF RUST 10 DISEASE-RESISTANCE LOCUS RECEPTOR-LIKE PROTEIN KINASE-like 1.3 isoform X2 [Malus sylvestris]|uniref:LEAF RUST 10 DISEASE-RESISTANCE LOCUS RECEPTOR-LIKE PROTEIN KINASE-like 1.3 isoform X2 n=1 Tax=Malus sylvestris TaxID=3752 RepID=UPI0021AC1BCE|nr:LEAF RUST 10 DISEASE-RESISTANCE LOCUS RECEPTOR-LIKE PROTEIN KINASE-like 1.3 isoform X2 [Malus sylvestris]
MNSWFFFSSHFAFFVFINFPLSSSFDSYTYCSNAFNCGDITEVGFPFWGDGRPESCGYPELKLTCSNDVTAIEIMGVKYRLLKINQGDQTLKIVRDDYCDKVCSPKFGDTKLNSKLFDYVVGSSDVTLLYDCTSSSKAEDFSCPDDEAYEDVAAIPADVPESPICKSKVVVRISDATFFRIFSIQNATALEAVVREGFEVKYKVDSENCGECVSSKGVCGYDWNLNETVCHCANQASESRTCSAATAEAIDNPAVVPPPAKGLPSTQCNISNTVSPVFSVPSWMVEQTSSVSCRDEVIVPVYTAADQAVVASQTTVSDAVKGRFPLEFQIDTDQCNKCEESGGRCGLITNSGFSCFCRDQAYATICNGTSNSTQPGGGSGSGGGGGSGSGSGGNKPQIKIGLAVGGAILFGVFVGFYVYYFIQRKKKKLAAETQGKELPTPLTSKGVATPSTDLSQFQSIPSYPSFTSKSDYDNKGSTYFGVQVFSYNELEEATENFNPAKELGDGGFGTVYYGKLHDGRVVAVKRLYENNFKRVEQFMNEVEILTRLEHRNLVKLYGCTSRRSRELLLVYEYIPNGTVADHLHGKRVESGCLSWPVRLSIAIETADALAFLHRNDVIHRDVKTNNILIDNDFCVKVADFGLSRLFPNDVTHVSTAPQGTPGYVDPEYYQCYQLTDKSDVYSFGVVLIELLSSLQAVDTNRHRHDINLANLAVNKIQNHLVNELVDPHLGYETNYSVRQMTTAVAELAFRCLQQERDMRPTMDEVLEGLKAVQNEDLGSENGEAVVLDIRSDEVGLLRNMPPPLSPDSNGADKLVFKRWDRTI